MIPTSNTPTSPVSSNSNQVPSRETLRRQIKAELADIGDVLKFTQLPDELSMLIEGWHKKFSEEMKTGFDERVLLEKYTDLLQKILVDALTLTPLDEEARLGNDGKTYGCKSLCVYLAEAPQNLQHRSPLFKNDPKPFTTIPHPLVKMMLTWLKSRGAILHSAKLEQEYQELVDQNKVPRIPTEENEKIRQLSLRLLQLKNEKARNSEQLTSQIFNIFQFVSREIPENEEKQNRLSRKQEVEAPVQNDHSGKEEMETPSQNRLSAKQEQIERLKSRLNKLKLEKVEKLFKQLSHEIKEECAPIHREVREIEQRDNQRMEELQRRDAEKLSSLDIEQLHLDTENIRRRTTELESKVERIRAKLGQTNVPKHVLNDQFQRRIFKILEETKEVLSQEIKEKYVDAIKKIKEQYKVDSEDVDQMETRVEERVEILNTSIEELENEEEELEQETRNLEEQINRTDGRISETERMNAKLKIGLNQVKKAIKKRNKGNLKALVTVAASVAGSALLTWAIQATITEVAAGSTVGATVTPISGGYEFGVGFTF